MWPRGPELWRAGWQHGQEPPRSGGRADNVAKYSIPHLLRLERRPKTGQTTRMMDDEPTLERELPPTLPCPAAGEGEGGGAEQS